MIVACDVETLYEKMLPAHPIPQELKEKLRKAHLYSSSVTISVALDCTPDELGFNEEMIHIPERIKVAAIKHLLIRIFQKSSYSHHHFGITLWLHPEMLPSLYLCRL